MAFLLLHNYTDFIDISIVAHRIRTILGFNVKKYISFRFNINSAVCMAADTRSACHI